MKEKRYENKYSRFISDVQEESRWSDEEEIMSSNTFVDIESGSFDAAGIPFISDGKKAYVNTADDHCLIYGSTGSKKTRTFVLPTVGIMLKAGESVVCTDPKGEIYANSAEYARKSGYNVIMLNFRDFTSGDGYNPFSEIYRAYHSGRQDEAMEQIDDFISAIAAEEKSSGSDPFWYRTASQLAVAHALFLMETADKDTANISSFTTLCFDENYESLCRLSRLMEHDSVAGMNYRCVYGEPEKTRMSTQATLTGMVQPFLSNTRLQNMLSETTFDMGEIGRKKTIVYIIISDEKPTYYFLVSMFIKQLYESAESVENPEEVNKAVDDFLLAVEVFMGEEFAEELRQALLANDAKKIDELMKEIQEESGNYDRAGKAQPPRDPLIIDLGESGIELRSLEHGVNFDLDNNGFAEKTAWIGTEDGFLALDRNGNGNIDNGGELFGDQVILKDGSKSESGFEALLYLNVRGRRK